MIILLYTVSGVIVVHSDLWVGHNVVTLLEVDVIILMVVLLFVLWLAISKGECGIILSLATDSVASWNELLLLNDCLDAIVLIWIVVSLTFSSM